MHFSHRLFENDLYKHDYAADKAKSDRDKSWQQTQYFGPFKSLVRRKKRQDTKLFVSFFFLKNIWLAQNIVFIDMICHDASWLCPRRNRLVIITFWKVYEKNALGFHFWNWRSDVTAMLYSSSIILQRVSPPHKPAAEETIRGALAQG